MESQSKEIATETSCLNIALNEEELCQTILVTSLKSSGSPFGRFVQNALRSRFPGRLANGDEKWIHLCTASLPLSVRKHAMAKLAGGENWTDMYAILEVTRAYLRSVFLPLSENAAGRRVSKFEHLEQLNKEISAVLQCRNWAYHLQPVSISEVRSCLRFLHRFVERVKNATDNNQIGQGLFEKIGQSLDVLTFVQNQSAELPEQEKLRSDNTVGEETVVETGFLQVPGFYLEKNDVCSVLLMRALRTFSRYFSILLLDKDGLLANTHTLDHQKPARCRKSLTSSEKHADVKDLLEIFRGLCRSPGRFPVPSSSKSRLQFCCSNILQTRNKLAHGVQLQLSDAQRCVQDCLTIVQSAPAVLGVGQQEHMEMGISELKRCKQDLHFFAAGNAHIHQNNQDCLLNHSYSNAAPAYVHLTPHSNSSNFSDQTLTHLSNSHRVLFPLARLHGRERELSKLISLLMPLRNGCCPKVLLAGQPGIGKTALAVAASAELSDVYASQYLLQASSLDTLYCDLIMQRNSTFSVDNGKTEKLIMAILSSLPRSLLVFDDLFDPRLVTRIVQQEKHAMLFVTHSSSRWRRQPGLSRCLTGSMTLGVLDSEQAYSLLRYVVIRGTFNRKVKWSTINRHRELIKDRLLAPFDHLPLAIIILGTLLAQDLLPPGKLLLCVQGGSDFCLSTLEANSASLGDRHVRGITGIVDLALEYLPKDELTKQLLYILAFIPQKRVPKWFLRQVVGNNCQYDFSDDCFIALLQGGLVQEETVEAGQPTRLSMHTLVQGCILDKWKSKVWARHLEEAFFVVVWGLLVPNTPLWDEGDKRDVKVIFLSTIYKHLDGCLCHNSFCDSAGCVDLVSVHVCQPALFLRAFFEWLLRLPWDVFDLHFGCPNFESTAVALQNGIHAVSKGFFLLRDCIPALSGNEQLWSILLDKVLCFLGRVRNTSWMDVLFFWKIVFGKAFIEHVTVVDDQLTRSFHRLSSTLVMKDATGVGHPSNSNITEADVSTEELKHAGKFCSLPEPRFARSCKDEKGPCVFSPDEDVSSKIEPERRRTKSGVPRDLAQCSDLKSNSSSCRANLTVNATNAACSKDDHKSNQPRELRSFLLSTDKKWSMEDARHWEMSAADVISEWKCRDALEHTLSYSDVALAMWSALSSAHYELAVKILAKQTALVKPGGILQLLTVAQALSALTILLYFKGTPALILETACTLLCFISWLLAESGFRHGAVESADRPRDTEKLMVDVQRDLVSFLVSNVCLDSDIDEQLTAVISVCKRNRQWLTAEHLSRQAKTIAEKRMKSEQLLLRNANRWPLGSVHELV